MRVLGGWIALTPELGAKLLFGRHVWDCAQHADAWGRRLPELRAPAQQSEPANERVVAFMSLLETPETPDGTIERVTGVYRVLKPHLATLYARHLAETNPVYEPPTRRILERCLVEERRHIAAGAVVLERLLVDAAARERAARWERRLADALAAAHGVTGDVIGPLVDRDPLGDVDPRADLVAEPPPIDPGALPADLAIAVDAQRRALETGDARAAASAAAPAARATLAAQFATLGVFERSAIVGLASIGRQRVVKLRLEGPRSCVTLQQRWEPGTTGWRVAAAEVVRAGPSIR